MRYVGSKRRLVKEIAPILQNTINNWGGVKVTLNPLLVVRI